MTIKKSNQIFMRSSTAEYLTYAASVCGETKGIGVRY